MNSALNQDTNADGQSPRKTAEMPYPQEVANQDDLYLSENEICEIRPKIFDMPKHVLDTVQQCDLELLLDGAFLPLDGFLAEQDYDSVLDRMRLYDGTPWPIPIDLAVAECLGARLSLGSEIALVDSQGVVLAVMGVECLWRPDKRREAIWVFGTEDPAHPGVARLFRHAGSIYLGGRVRGVERPAHFDYQPWRFRPAELRARFAALVWTQAVALQTRNPLHSAHMEVARRAADQIGGKLLIHPVVGCTMPGDIDHYTRTRCNPAALSYFPKDSVVLALLQLAMRMAGPREAVWHAIVRRNYGSSHLIVGRDHASPGSDGNGDAFYPPFAARDLAV